MKSKLLIYALPILLVSFLLVGYSIQQDDPINDSAPVTTDVNYNSVQSDTNAPAGFPYPTLWNFNYSAIAGVNGGTVGACLFQNRYYLNRWNNAVLYRYNNNGTNGGPGTLADSIAGYNGGTGAIRDMTVAPDGSGNTYLWGGAAASALYKMDANGTRLATYTHAGAVYRAVAWDPNRKGFWSCNFADNIVCRDTNGTILKTITNTFPAKYGMGFDSTSSADSAFLWVWEQGPGGTAATTAILHKLYIGTGLDVKTYNFNLTGPGVGIAGGAEVFQQNNQLVLALNFQNQATIGYKLKDLGPPPGGGTITVCRNGRFVQIPENGGNANPGIDTITVAGIPGGNVIRKMTVKIDTVIHTYIGDLRFWLTHGTAVDTIISRVGWTGTGFGNSCDNFFGTNLKDSVGLVNIQNVPAACVGGNAQVTGTFNPKSPLSVFSNSDDPNGTYILRVSDNAGGDTGRIRAWCVTIEYGLPIGVQNNTLNIADSYSLSQNYPNPFNPTTSINYSIPKAGLVSLKVYDILGKEVASIVNEFMTAGNHEVNFDASSLSSGVYFYRITSGNFIDTKKMFLLK